MVMMSLAVEYLLLFLTLTSLCSAQAPGDEAARCTIDHSNPPVYPDNERTLMDSYSYVNLLPGNGTGQPPEDDAVWNDMSFDENDLTDTLNPTYWQQGAGGICRYQVRVCGFRQDGVIVPQNNWLFTQHIDKAVIPDLDNYPTKIKITLTYALQSCRKRQGCEPSFQLYMYQTNTAQLPSTSGSGFMNRNKYDDWYQLVVPEATSMTFSETFSFNLSPGQTGFYLAVRDNGTCLGISRFRVFRDHCAGYRDGLVLYPDAPAPLQDKAPVQVECVANAARTGNTLTVMCNSLGSWEENTATCGCSPGYQVTTAGDSCEICPAGTYQALVSDSEQCKECPAQSSSMESGTAVCECFANFIRHPDRPDDPCARSPSAPRFDLNNPPILDGTDVSLVWLPSADSGGDPENLYYDVYAAQLDGDDPVFCRQNEEPIDDDCNSNGRDCSFKVTGLNANTPYALLVVAANSATDDPDCVYNITVLGSRYLVLVVGTEDAAVRGGLSAGTAGGIAFGVTFPLTAIITAVIVVLIMYYLIGCRRSRSKYSSSSKNGPRSDSTTAMMTSTTLSKEDSVYPSIDQKLESPDFGQSKPHPPKKSYVPSRPAAPPKPSGPQRPNLPVKPPAYSHSNNGY